MIFTAAGDQVRRFLQVGGPRFESPPMSVWTSNASYSRCATQRSATSRVPKLHSKMDHLLSLVATLWHQQRAKAWNFRS